MFQKMSHDNAILGRDTGSAAQLDSFVASPSNLLLVALVLYEFVITYMHHHMPTLGEAEPNCKKNIRLNNIRRFFIQLYVAVGLIGTGIDCFASYCLSKQGKMGINVGGYRFRFNGCARNGKIRWRCSRGPWCKAALHTYRGRIVYIQSTHNCGPKPPS
ncbi:uncharacterized protein LOC123868967 [Maniola jurtina]|uniref:uncharacterized protein LOC123868967 n=1 Tax=Maniola jurtina TaxID=191418 RepID=UPI001E6886A6|nr:uncharacterized protein LOC123868967 [Maniola jurtina]